MVVSFVRTGTGRASVVKSGFSTMETLAAGEFLPAEFLEKCSGAWILGVDGRECRPVDCVVGG